MEIKLSYKELAALIGNTYSNYPVGTPVTVNLVAEETKRGQFDLIVKITKREATLSASPSGEE